MFRKTLTYWFMMISGIITVLIPVIAFVITLLVYIIPISFSGTFYIPTISEFFAPLPFGLILVGGMFLLIGILPAYTILFICIDCIIYIVKSFKNTSAENIIEQELLPGFVTNCFRDKYPNSFKENKTLKHNKIRICIEIFLFIMYLVGLIAPIYFFIKGLTNS